MANPSDPQAFNRYSYVLGNPLRYVDPSGHASVCGFSYSDPECYGPDLWTLPPSGGGGGGSGGGGGGNKPDLIDDVFVPLDDGLQQNDPTPTQPTIGVGSAGGDNESVSNVAAMATLLDTIAAGLNGGYAIVGDIVGLACPACYGAVVTGYWYFSFIPNMISTVSMGLWFSNGVVTGENSLTFSQTSQDTTISLSVSQDTIVAVGTNIAGWTILREPNIAFWVDAGVAGYDYARMGMIPFVDYTLPAFINPTLTYNTNTGFNFSWQRSE